MLLIAKGWRIIRPTLPGAEVRTMFVALILLLATLLFFSFYNDGYYFLSLMIMYFFMLPKIFTSITTNTTILEAQILMTGRAQTDNDATSLLQKLHLFKTLRTSVVVYLGSILLVSAMRIIMVWYLDWFNFVMNELVVVLTIALVSYILLPHNHLVFSPMTIHPDFNLGHYNFDDLTPLDYDELNMMSQEPSIDLTGMIVIEFPHKLSHGVQSPSTIPLAIALPEKPKEKRNSKDGDT